MVTFVNGTFGWHLGGVSDRLALVGGWVFTRCIEHIFEHIANPMMREVLL
jgi:hypothetical protein